MGTPAVMSKPRSFALWAMVVLYLFGRLCQLEANHLPALLIVVLHVAPPAIFALLHGSILYRLKGMVMFTVLCLGIGTVSETLSLRTGFPFGHYVFTEVMGPKLFQLPLLLVLAYLGIGYVAWVLALLILGYADKPLSGVRLATLPLLASFLMLAWDLSMEADWSTVDRAWVWPNGGAYFGVPITNFLGWYLTSFLIYLFFALSIRTRPVRVALTSRSFWRSAIIVYVICAAGNLLPIYRPMAPPVVVDPSGRSWMTVEILAVGALLSVAVMGPMALLAWLRLKEWSGQAS